jgi:hypothetical protein
MANVVERLEQVPPFLAAPRVIALVSVPWSPWPRRSRQSLEALEASREEWLPGCPVEFFDLRPEQEEELNRWYDALCRSHWPRFALHGDGYGPLWWLARGQVLDCLSKPYGYCLESLQRRSECCFKASSRAPDEGGRSA